jgi:hypothetical protein
VRRLLTELEEAGFIRREPRFVEGRQTTTNYVFMMQILSGRDDAAVPPEGDRSVLPGGDNSVPQNRKKEPEEVTTTYRGATKTFDDWWRMYPKKVAKKAAERAWRNLTAKKRAAAFEDCVNREWPDTRFVPNPATYLNGERWTDEQSGEWVDPLLDARSMAILRAAQ